MKAKPHQLNALAKKLQTEFAAALVFGTDASEVQEIAKNIQKIVLPNPGPFSLISLTPADLKSEPNRVLEEANTADLMGERRFIWLKEAGAQHADIMTDFVANRQTDAFLLMTADNLMKSAALRVESEASPDILVVACYPPEVMDLRRIVQNFSKEVGFDFTPEAVDYLIQNTNNNTLILKNELSKIQLWNQNKKRIDFEQIQCLVGMGTVTQDSLIQAVANRQTAIVINTLNALLLQGENPVTLIRSIARYFSNLLKGVDRIEQGEVASDVVKKILRPAQFRLEESVMGQLHSWRKSDLLKAHHILLNAEVQMKSGVLDPELILKQSLLMLAKK